jgi:rhomboid protease GluP
MRPVVLYSIIAANIAMFIAVLAMGGDVMNPSARVLFELGGNYAGDTVSGEPWRLLTAMFLHAGILHLAMNMYCLYQVAPLESYFGRLGFFVLYLVSGLMGGVASLARMQEAVSIGASGAVFGLFGALFVVIYQRRHELSPDVYKSQLMSLAQFVGLNLVIGFVVPGIDQAAHIGGLVGGAACAWVMRPLQHPSARARLGAVTAAGVGLTALAVVLLGA